MWELIVLLDVTLFQIDTDLILRSSELQHFISKSVLLNDNNGL